MQPVARSLKILGPCQCCGLKWKDPFHFWLLLWEINFSCASIKKSRYSGPLHNSLSAYEGPIHRLWLFISFLLSQSDRLTYSNLKIVIFLIAFNLKSWWFLFFFTHWHYGLGGWRDMSSNWGLTTHSIEFQQIDSYSPTDDGVRGLLPPHASHLAMLLPLPDSCYLIAIVLVQPLASQTAISPISLGRRITGQYWNSHHHHCLLVSQPSSSLLPELTSSKCQKVYKWWPFCPFS